MRSAYFKTERPSAFGIAPARFGIRSKTLALILIGLLPAGAAAQAYPAGQRDHAATSPSAAPSWAEPSAPADARRESTAAPASPLAPQANVLPLSPPGHGRPLPSSGQAPATGGRRNDGLRTLATAGSSLALVLGLFLLLAMFLRRTTPGSSAILPEEVVEVLGRAPLAARQQIHLLRCGNKLLLVSVTPAGVETLTEITEPAEVDRLAGLCRQAHPGSATAMFRNVLHQFGREPVASGPLSDDQRADLDLANSGIFGRRRDAWEGADG